MANIDTVEAVIRRAGCGFALCFTPHRGGYKFALAPGVVLTAAEYQVLGERFSAAATVTLDTDARRRNNLRHKAGRQDESAR